ncbi:serine hydrolase domain-containing protein [Paenibacillus sp. FSL L8-0463]|uniref:serine hydrolase domain-containing protein n=1 Tax=Paenibacillus sp. FSL L8-0463 TaxID=2954687 RepID=UPI003119EFEF
MKLSRGIPDHHGISSRNLLDFFTEIEQRELEVNQFMLLRNGVVTAEFSRTPYRPDCPQLLYSLSKSVTSTAIGIACDEGLMELEAPVISFFPDKLPQRISANLAKMTVHHLLSMNAGHHDNIYGAVAREQDFVRAFLAQDVPHEPGSYYVYSTHSTYMLSAIMEQVAGQGMVDFLMPRLFEPLGIPRPSWETCPLGITAGGMGLSLSIESIAKFGQLLLNKGLYAGKRIVSQRYIELATMEQSDNRRLARADRVDSAQGYGYQFHLCRRRAYRGDGSFGQLCFVAPEQQIVIAATSAFENMTKLQRLLDLIYDYIIDRLDQGGVKRISIHSEDTLMLQRRLAAMAYPVPAFKPIPENIPNLVNRCYLINENPHGLQKIIFEWKDEQLELHMFYGDERDNVILFHFSKPLHGADVFPKDLSQERQEVVTYALWENARKLQLILFYIETPYVVTYTIAFHDNKIDFAFNINVSLDIPNYRVTGRFQQ